MHGDSDYHTEKILYDTEMYNYPAYISIDGYDTVYEYALIDEENNRIIYALLSYPRLTDLVKYQEYLKKDKLSYKTDDGSTLEKFSIYSFSFDDGIWSEYGPEDEGRTTTGNPR